MPQKPGARVVATAPPDLSGLPAIAAPVQQLGKGGENTVSVHPDNPDLVVKLRHRGRPEEALGRLHLEMSNLSWLAQAGFPAVTPVGLVRIEGTDEAGLVLPRLREVVFTKDFENGMGREGMAIWREMIAGHGQSVLERLDAIRVAINKSEINVVDLQFAINRDGGVTIVDPYVVMAASARPYMHHLNKVELAIASDMQALDEGRMVSGVPWDDVDGL
jgi:hypothetical protein